MRYINQKKGLLDSEHYKNFLENRGLKTAVIHTSVSFKGLENIDVAVVNYGVWSTNSSLHKISQELYGTIEFWWTIGLINGKPTDAHFSIGDPIIAPVTPSILKNKIGEI